MKRRNGFTLIELLIVIAIIAILVAILVPVFFKVKESARQGTVMENMKLIGQGLAAYKLDNHRAPDVLFGYANGGTMESYKPASTVAALPVGLYPSYVKTADVFQDPNNSAAADATTGPITARLVAPCSDAACASANPGDIVSVQRTFYTADAYDVCPQVTGGSTVSTTPLVRYARGWERLDGADANAGRQMQAPNPPGNTYVTCTTYHVPNADKVLILFEDGSVKKMTGADFAAQESGGNFWTVKP